MQLFFSDLITEQTKNYTFQREESKHIIKVLRKRINDCIHITNGKGQCYSGTIISENPNKCTVSLKLIDQQDALPYKLHIAVAPTKVNDRFEWFLEKATEIGVTDITPILCDHSERKHIKWERFDKIIQSATKQSLQYHKPQLHQLTPIKAFINNTHATNKFIAHCENHEKKYLKNLITPKSDSVILIGPEGDFSLNEINLALQHNYSPVSLGNTRLRTETAAIVAVHTFALA